MTNLQQLEKEHYFIGIIDGAKCHDISEFLIEAGTAFKFPEYYGKNMNALDECLNDLSWIENDKFALVIKNYPLFLSRETSIEKLEIIKFLNKVSNEWASVPNYPGEDEFRNKASFVILVYDSNDV